MEELIAITRGYGAENIPLVAGFNWAYDLTPVLADPIQAEGIAYVSHPYPQKRDQPWTSAWEADFGHVADQYPIVLTEIGYCGPNTQGAHIPVISDASYPKAILAYAGQRGMSYCLWCFDPQWSPRILENWTYQLTEEGAVWFELLGKE